MDARRPTWLQLASSGLGTVSRPARSASANIRRISTAESRGAAAPVCEKVARRIEELFSLVESPIRRPVSTETRKYARLFLAHFKRDKAAIAALGASRSRH
jgi:hypothetical protein